MELEKILKACRDYDVAKLRMDDLFVEFTPRQIAVPVFDSPMKQPIGTELAPTEDQLMMWSTGEPFETEAKQPEL